MNQSIYKAMRVHLNTLLNKPPIAYLDQAYSPTGVQYLREGFYSASPDHLSIEYGGATDHRGYYQIEILTPSNSGSAEGIVVGIEAGYFDLLNVGWPRFRYTPEFAPGIKYFA